ncbi:MAG: hypothetical protein ACRCUY_07595 [Thermoguttaceae bacterium]
MILFYVFLTAVLCTYSQLIFKWRMASFGPLPEDLWAKGFFVLGCLFDPFVISGFLSGFLATLCWLVAISKLNVSYAYPIVLCTVLVFVTIGGVVLFEEKLSTPHIAGLVLLLVGLSFFVFK